MTLTRPEFNRLLRALKCDLMTHLGLHMFAHEGERVTVPLCVPVSPSNAFRNIPALNGTSRCEPVAESG